MKSFVLVHNALLRWDNSERSLLAIRFRLSKTSRDDEGVANINDTGYALGMHRMYDDLLSAVQKIAEHDEVFLDWVFWWYLATVELAGKVAARDRPVSGAEAPAQMA